MSALLRSIATQPAQALAIQDSEGCWSYADLRAEVESFAARVSSVHCLGLLLDNGAAWVVADLAARQLNRPCVPIPHFFSPQQIQHVLQDAGIDVLLSQQALPGLPQETLVVAGQSLFLHRLPSTHSALPTDCAKLTYTSGTTAQPKGVCLSEAAMLQVAQSIIDASEATADERHVCTLPLSLLLANISAVYAPLLLGGCCYLPRLQAVGWQGASGLDAASLLGLLERWQAHSSVFVPQMLQALLLALQTADATLPHMRYLAVGGAPLARNLQKMAVAQGLPVFEGYGLSECASVVCLNTAAAHKPGSVGQPLPHVEIRIADDGELLVKGAQLQAYLNHPLPPCPDGFWATGDFAEQDDEGFVFLKGRKKTCFITAYGRNVAPEWVEQELCAQPLIAQAVVYGEALPHNIAVLQARSSAASDAQIETAVQQANQHLPDYAQVKYWRHSHELFPQGWPLNPAGVPDRAAVNAVLDHQARHS